MIGGCQRRMYYVKDTKSKFFLEAYFVLRDGAETERMAEADLAAEAERILEERFSKRRKARSKKFKRTLTAMAMTTLFMIGLAVGVVVAEVL